VRTTEHSAKTPAPPRTGSFAVRFALLRGRGSGAPSSRLRFGGRTPALRLTAMLALATAGVLALTAAPASAFDTHAFKESFGVAGSGDGQFELAATSGLAVNETTHNVYVADTNNHRVDVFSETGAFIRAFGADVGGTGVNVCTAGCVAGAAGSSPGSFEAPTFLAIDNAPGGEGDVYVADTGANLVSKFKADGTLISSWGVGGQLSEGGGESFTSLRGLAVDSAGNLDLIENEPHLLFRFERGAGFIAAVETPRENFAAGLAVDPSGDFFKANGSPSVEKFEASGTDVGQVSAESAGGATGLAVDPSNGQLFTDVGAKIDNYTFNGSGEVIERSSTCPIEPSVGCEPTSIFGSSKLTAGAGLAVDGSTHNVFAADPGAGKITVFAPLTLPDATTEAATAITRETATLNGTVGAAGGPEATCTFQYLTEAEYEANPEGERFAGATSAPCSPAGPFTGSSSEAVSAAISGLELGTAYRFRLLAESEEGQNPGEALSFTTQPAVIVTTGEATAITDHSATLNGEIDPEGVEIEECRFEYLSDAAFQENLQRSRPGYLGASSVLCVETPAAIGFGNAPVPVEADLEGLSGGTTFHFRLAARNSFGESSGADATFTTPGPAILEEFATGVSATAATLGAEVNPNGQATTYEFQYVPDAAYQVSGYAEAKSAPAGGEAIGSSSLPIALRVQLQGLQPLTTYHYRVLARSAAGASFSEDRSFTTQGPNGALLPDGRQWEQVTPPNKYGSPPEFENLDGAINQAASAGGNFATAAAGPLGPHADASRSPATNQWFSARSQAGWSTVDITVPREEITFYPAGHDPEYPQFSTDLSSAILEPDAATPLSPWATERTPYRREPNGEFIPLLVGCPEEPQPCPPAVAEHANVPPGTEFGGETGGVPGGIVSFSLATPDLSHVVLSSYVLLTEDFAPGFDPQTTPSLYEFVAGRLTLVSVLPSGEPAAEAGAGSALGNGQVTRGAISDDGSRVVFGTSSNSGEEHLFLRLNSTQPQSSLDGEGNCAEPAQACTIQLDLPQEEAAGGTGHPEFQAANSDDSKIFFLDDARLTTDSAAATGDRDLYMCEVEEVAGHLACALTDLSVDSNPGKAARVAGTVSAIDASGQHVFFAADGVLTNEPNPRGEVALPGRCSASEGASTEEAPCNLYSYDTDTHQISLVGVLSSRDAPDWAKPMPVLSSLTARTSPDGHWLAFMSRRPLTGYDNRDARTGERDEEVFLYDSATEALRCASCNPTGARPTGVFDPGGIPTILVDHHGTWAGSTLAATIPGWTNRRVSSSVYQPRYLSDSGRLFFDAADALVPTDTNRLMDVYQYEPPQGPAQPASNSCTTSSPAYKSASGGCVSLISSGTSPEESAFLDASESGDDVFFLTASKLAPTDTDNATDVYDAHACSASSPCPPPPPPPPPACEGDACQPPATPPVDATPGSLTLNGAGNVVQCPKGKIKKSGKCVKKHKARKHHKKHKKSKRTASHNRGGQK
jgi:hypothetical protein